MKRIDRPKIWREDNAGATSEMQIMRKVCTTTSSLAIKQSWLNHVGSVEPLFFCSSFLYCVSDLSIIVFGLFRVSPLLRLPAHPRRRSSGGLVLVPPITLSSFLVVAAAAAAAAAAVVVIKATAPQPKNYWWQVFEPTTRPRTISAKNNSTR